VADDELQRELEVWLQRLQQVDHVLRQPAQTLIRVYKRWQKEKASQPSVPTCLTRMNIWPGEKAPLVHAVTCSTLQRLARHRPRYSWLDAHKKELAPMLADAAEPFLPKLEASSDPMAMVDAFEDGVFGALNPLAAAEAFAVLINAGERTAHRGAGFLLLFSMLWSLHRKFPRDWERGARLDPTLPTASVTAKCLVVIRRLHKIIARRADRYRDLAAALKQTNDNASTDSQLARWRFTVALERISTAAHALADVAINGPKFLELAREVAALADSIGPETATRPLWIEVSRRLNAVLIDLRKTNEDVLGDARAVHDRVVTEIVRRVSSVSEREAFALNHCRQIQFRSIRADQLGEYWSDLQAAAEVAREDCGKAIAALVRGVDACAPLREGGTPDCATLAEVLDALARANVDVAQQLADTVKPNIDWMPIVIREHVAYASAGNFTQFDPAELLSAVSVAERWRSDFTQMEARDAIQKAIAGERGDGSWMTTQPIYLVKRFHGVWPSTPDVGWLLALAASGRNDVTQADDALCRYLGWLEKNRIDLHVKDEILSGWSSETHEQEVIDLWSTCVAINSLIEIRQLFEYRLWQLCQRRFVIRRGHQLRPLAEIDPVDLGMVHERRLHRRLARIARETSRETEEGSEPAEYGLVLHGPPGSSKTAIAEALGREMWGLGEKARFIRITPADFTRGGESGLDREARFIFDLLLHVRKVTIFFDEIDDLLRLRESGGGVSFIKLIVPAMLNRLQDLRDAAPRQEISFLLATNFIDNIEPALTRPGRIDGAVPVPYPDAWSRDAIFERIVKTPVEPAVRELVARSTGGWPWSTYRRLCERIAAMRPVTVAGAEEVVNHLASEFESADFYYFRPERWKGESRPLMNEFIHEAFSIAKARDVCEAKVEALRALLVKAGVTVERLDFRKAFADEWQRTHAPK
jgi:hypothetical protein